MITLNCLYVEESDFDIDELQKDFYDNGIEIIIDRVNSEKKFVNKLTNNDYDVVLSCYPNKLLNILTILGLNEIRGKNIPLILLFFNMSADMYEYSKEDSGKIVFLNKNKIDEIIPKICNKLKNMLKYSCKG
jgi:hypothetical protein